MKTVSVKEVNMSKLKNAYDAYLFLFDKYKQEPLVYWSRLLECSVNEAGFNGLKTGLISIEALDTKIKKAKKQFVSNLDNISLEHPITFKVLALHALKRKTPLCFDQYFKLWEDNLVTTFVTSKQNKALIKFQKDFVLGVDCWKQMYKKAGIKLVENVDLRKDSVRIQYGMTPINRGRKKKS